MNSDFDLRAAPSARLEGILCDYLNRRGSDFVAFRSGIERRVIGDALNQGRLLSAVKSMAGNPHADALRLYPDLTVLCPAQDAALCLEVKACTARNENAAVALDCHVHGLMAVGIEIGGEVWEISRRPPVLFVFALERAAAADWRACTPAQWPDYAVPGDFIRVGSANGSGKPFVLFRYKEMPRLADALADIRAHVPGAARGVLSADESGGEE